MDAVGHRRSIGERAGDEFHHHAGIHFQHRGAIGRDEHIHTAEAKIQRLCSRRRRAAIGAAATASNNDAPGPGTVMMAV
jgi:hypothetical protein